MPVWTGRVSRHHRTKHVTMATHAHLTTSVSWASAPRERVSIVMTANPAPLTSAAPVTVALRSSTPLLATTATPARLVTVASLVNASLAPSCALAARTPTVLLQGLGAALASGTASSLNACWRRAQQCRALRQQTPVRPTSVVSSPGNARSQCFPTVRPARMGTSAHQVTVASGGRVSQAQ